MIRQIDEATGQVHAEWEWDSQGRLVGADSDGDGAQNVRYEYDADGNRVAKIAAGEETRFLVDANRSLACVLMEYTPAGDVKVAYVHGRRLVSQDRLGHRSDYLFDGHSGVRQLADATGLITDRYTYDAFGVLLTSAGGTLNDFLYQGEQTEHALQWQYLRSRYYDPGIGRFVSADTFEGFPEQPMSRHTYLYTSGNPVNFVDPTGQYMSLIDVMTVLGIVSTLCAIAQWSITNAVTFAIGVGKGEDPYYLWHGDMGSFGVGEGLVRKRSCSRQARNGTATSELTGGGASSSAGSLGA